MNSAPILRAGTRVSGAALGLMASLVVLAGCKSVADDPTVPAFADAASSARTSFETARSQEAQAFLDLTLDLAAEAGTARSENCVVVASAKDCHVRLIVNGVDVNMQPVGTKLAADADKLAAYGDALKQLASASDLADQQAALQKLSGSVGGVMQAAGVPGIDAVGNLVADLVHQAALNHRREELLAIAEKVDPAIQSMAQLLTSETGLLQQNIVLTDSQTVSELQQRFLAAGPTDPNRRSLAEQLISAADAEQRAASLTPDFSPLAKAHAKMIESLRNPKISLTSAMSEISALADELDKIKTAFTPSKKAA